MVIINTSAVDVSIHAVSPLSSLASWANAGPADSNRAVVAIPPARAMADNLVKFILYFPLDCVVTGLTGTYSDYLFQRINKNFPVTDLAGLSRLGNRFNDRFDDPFCDRNVDLDLGQKIGGALRHRGRSPPVPSGGRTL